jgi:hypothetical protein
VQLRAVSGLAPRAPPGTGKGCVQCGEPPPKPPPTKTLQNYAVSRTHAGRRLGEVLGEAPITSPIDPSAVAVAIGCDVVVEYTRPVSAKATIGVALSAAPRRGSGSLRDIPHRAWKMSQPGSDALSAVVAPGSAPGEQAARQTCHAEASFLNTGTSTGTT